MKKLILALLVIVSSLISPIAQSETKLDPLSKNIREYQRRYLYLVEVSNNKELNRIQKKNISEIISNAQVKILKTSYFPLKDSMIRSLDNIQADFTSGNLASANKRLIAYQKYIAPLIYLSTKLDF